MASIRFKFRASSVSGKQGTLFIQVIHRRVARQVSTQYKLYPGEWDPAGQSVTVPKDTLPDRSRYLHAVQEALRAIYNQAVEQGLTPQTHPFARVYTGIAKTVISEAMGHSTQRTTYIYLKSFENTPVDRANRKVLSVIA